MDIKDKKERIISFDESFGTIRAYHNDDEIGSFQFIETTGNNPSDDYHILDQMHIKSDYQKAGIGVQIMLFAIEVFNRVFVFSRLSEGEQHYTNEGLQFVEYLIEQGIVDDPDLDNEEDDEDEYDPDDY